MEIKCKIKDGNYKIGIRPHNITTYKEGNNSVEINGKVLISELSGSESLIHFTNGNLNWVSLSNGTQQKNIGEDTKLYMNTDEFLYFDIKYSNTDNPSRKFARIGFSIIALLVSPDFLGFAIRPLNPASCLICCLLPRAPLSSIMYTELKPCLLAANSCINVSVTLVSTRLQISMIWL